MHIKSSSVRTTPPCCTGTTMITHRSGSETHNLWGCSGPAGFETQDGRWRSTVRPQRERAPLAQRQRPLYRAVAVEFLLPQGRARNGCVAVITGLPLDCPETATATSGSSED